MKANTPINLKVLNLVISLWVLESVEKDINVSRIH